MMEWIPYVVIPLVIIGIVIIKIKDVKNKQAHPPRQWEGEPASADEQRWHDAEKEAARRGSSISGGGGDGGA